MLSIPSLCVLEPSCYQMFFVGLFPFLLLSLNPPEESLGTLRARRTWLWHAVTSQSKRFLLPAGSARVPLTQVLTFELNTSFFLIMKLPFCSCQNRGDNTCLLQCLGGRGGKIGGCSLAGCFREISFPPTSQLRDTGTSIALTCDCGRVF